MVYLDGASKQGVNLPPSLFAGLQNGSITFSLHLPKRLLIQYRRLAGGKAINLRTRGTSGTLWLKLSIFVNWQKKGYFVHTSIITCNYVCIKHCCHSYCDVLTLNTHMHIRS